MSIGEVSRYVRSGQERKAPVLGPGDGRWTNGLVEDGHVLRDGGSDEAI